MAELFNAEQYRQEMSGQHPAPAQGYPQPMPRKAAPQPYQPPQMQQAQLQQPQMQQTQMQQTQAQPRPYQPQEWAPQHHQPQHPHVMHPHVMQPQTPVHHMPAAPVFAPPPGVGTDIVEEVPKTSRFKRGRPAKEKTPKVKITKIKKTKGVKNKGEAAEMTHTTKTSPAIIFMFGMATGIVCFLVGNMLMSNLLSDNSAKSFRDIERQNAQAQQPVLPKSAENTEG